jgi:hypothetical protein
MKELSKGVINIGDSWSILEMKLHFLRTIEFFRLDAGRYVGNEMKIALPLYLMKTGTMSKISGLSLVKIVQEMFLDCLSFPLESGKVETDDQERYYLVVAMTDLEQWMERIFGNGTEVGSPFNALAAVKDKKMENGSLMFGNPYFKV